MAVWVEWAEVAHQDQVSAYIYIYIYIYVGDRAFVFVFYPSLLSSRKYFFVTYDEIERKNWRHCLEIISQKIVVIR